MTLYSIRSIRSIQRTLAITLLLALAAGSASAQDEPDYHRPGWFVGAGGGVAVDFLEDAIEKAAGGLINIKSTGTFNMRGGYRLVSWFALEAMYEGAYGFSMELAGDEVASSTYHSLLVNGKLIVPLKRFQPYFALGLGGQQGEFDGRGVLAGLDVDRWDFVFRPAFGLDTYIDEHWLVNFEVAPSLRVRSYNDIPKELTDNLTLTVTAGVGYRF